MSKLKFVFLVVFCLIAYAIQGTSNKSVPSQGTSNQSVPYVSSNDYKPHSISSAWQQEPKEGVEIEENKTAKNYYIVFDESGSMQDSGCSGDLSKSNAAKRALESFSALLPSDAHIGLLTFDSMGIREILPLGIHARAEFLDKVRALQAGGGTPLNSAISKAVKFIELQGQKQLGYGEYTLIVVTDGEASNNEDPSPIVDYILDSTPIQLQTIGFCIGENHSLNQPGRTTYRTAQSAEQLVKELGNILAEADSFDQSTFSKVP